VKTTPSRGTLGASSVSAGGRTSVKVRFGIRVFATLLIDRVSGIISVFEGDSSRGEVIKTSLERARERAKTLKGLKTKNPDCDTRGCPRVRRSLAIIYEFGAPKKAMVVVGSAKCALYGFQIDPQGG